MVNSASSVSMALSCAPVSLWAGEHNDLFLAHLLGGGGGVSKDSSGVLIGPTGSVHSRSCRGGVGDPFGGGFGFAGAAASADAALAACVSRSGFFH